MAHLNKDVKLDRILCLQEPHISDKGITQLPKSYEAFWRTTGGGRPRSLIIAPKRFGGYLVTQHSNKDCVVIRVKSSTISIVSLYCDGLSSVREAWRLVELEIQHKSHVVICADLNATHQAWGGGRGHPRSRVRGKECLEKMEELNLHICNIKDAPPTYEGPCGRRSHIDVTCCSEPMIRKVWSWAVTQRDYGSDHRAIEFEIGGRGDGTGGKGSASISMPWKNPTKQGLKLMERLLPVKVRWRRRVNSPSEIENFWLVHAKEIRKALKEIFPDRKSRNRTRCYWWTAEVQEAYKKYKVERTKVRRMEKRAVEILPGQYEEVKILRGKWRYQVKLAKLASWKEFTTSINDPWTGIHKIVHTIDKGKSQCATLSNVQGEYGIDIASTLRMLAAQFFPPLPRRDDRHRKIEEEVEKQLRVRDEVEVSEVGVLEYRKALKDMRTNTAPGEDGITTNVIRILSDAGWETQYRHLFSASLKYAVVPADWKCAKIVLIPKEGADPTTTKSVRPISLTSIHCKLLERIINQRILHELERAGTMTSNQHAYNKGKSTVTALHEAVGFIENALARRWICQGVFLDISGAFDRAWHQGILRELLVLGVSKPLVRWTRTYLENRKATMQAAGVRHEVILGQGCPQGGVLSPLLWNVLFNRLLTTKESATPAGTPPIKIIGYADDALVLCQARTPASAARRLQRYLEKIQGWAEDYRVVFNPSKMSTIIFSTRQACRVAGSSSGLKFGGVDIRRVETYKYLGVLLDSRLKWSDHIEACLTKLGNITRMFRGCVREGWGVKTKVLKLLYEAIYKPVMTYGLSVWASGAQAKQTQKRFDKLTRNYALMATRTFRTSSQDVIMQLMGIKPFKEVMEEELMRVSILQLKLIGGRQIVRQVSPRLKRLHVMQNSVNLLDPRVHLVEHVNMAHYKDIHPLNWFQISVRYDNRIAALWSATDSSGWICYTDASSTSYGRGWGAALYRHGFLVDTTRGSLREASVFTTELHAILQATRLVMDWCKAGEGIINIKTDSLACVRALESCIQVDPNLRECWAGFRTAAARGLRLVLCWIPGHEGIEGNGFADRLAKSAVGSANLTAMHLVARDVRRYMEQTMKRMEQARFGRVTSSYFRAFVPNYEHLTTLRSRNHSAHLNQLLTGHCRLNHFLYKIGAAATTKCCCGEKDETIWHYLCKCKKFEEERVAVWNTPTLEIEEVVCTKWDQIEEFLRITGRLAWNTPTTGDEVHETAEH